MIRFLMQAWAVLLLGFALSASAALTDAEKQLLMSGMSAEAAEEFGKKADAAGLERIIAIGDPNLVSAFSTGLARSRIELMPPAIEALVVKHFDDPRLGEALRRMSPRYQSRALFDRYYALAKAAYRSNDPVFEQILRTDQPGIDEALLQIASRFPTRPGGDLNPAIAYAGQRKYPGAVEPLFAALEPGFANNALYSPPFSLLMNYESPDIWKRVATVLDRLERDKRISDKALSYARTQLNAQLADPEGYLARKHGAAAMAEFGRKRQALTPLANSLALHADPPRYVEEQAKYVAALEALAAEFHSGSIDYIVAGEYSALGVFTRFQAHDAGQAIRFLEKGAKGLSALGQIALADTYEFELHDKPAAIRAYRMALDTATKSPPGITPYSMPGQPQNEFWKGWFAAEIAYLESGQPFRGRIPEGAISGFWSLLPVWYNVSVGVVPNWPAVNRPVVTSTSPGYSGVGLNPRGTQAPDWAAIATMYSAASGTNVPPKLAALPASRLTLFVTLKYLSALNDPALILKELARQDPSGYWTTIILGTVAYHEAHGRDGALADGVADALPGMAGPGHPNALARAADQYLARRELRPMETK